MLIPRVPFHSVKQPDTLIEIIDINDLNQRKKSLDHDPEKPHRVAFHMLIFIEKGQGNHFLDFHSKSYSNNTFIFIRKNQIHAFDLSNSPQGKIILFTDSFIQKLQNNMKVPLFGSAYLYDEMHAVFKPSDSLKESCANLMIEIDKEVHQDSTNSMITMHLFAALFYSIERETILENAGKHSVQYEKTLSSFLNLLDAQYTKSRNVSDYASQLNITYKTLNKLCKQVTGKTAKYLVDAHVILESKRRLMLDTSSIQSLAFELGFDEVTNFVKYFKRHTKMTPTEFKKGY